MNELDVVRQDIRDLRTFLQTKFDDHDVRLREVEQHSAVTRSIAKLALVPLPFAVAAFSAFLYMSLGG